MSNAPHAPAHYYQDQKCFLVTAGTYRKQDFLSHDERLAMLLRELLRGFEEAGFLVQAYSVFSNHYHALIDAPTGGERIAEAVRRIHARTAVFANRADSQPGRQVWYQYWDTALEDEKAYYTRLHYVLQNPVSHGLVQRAEDYPYGSVRSFLSITHRPRRETVLSFKVDRVSIHDDYRPTWARAETARA